MGEFYEIGIDGVCASGFKFLLIVGTCCDAPRDHADGFGGVDVERGIADEYRVFRCGVYFIEGVFGKLGVGFAVWGVIGTDDSAHIF